MSGFQLQLIELVLATCDLHPVIDRPFAKNVTVPVSLKVAVTVTFKNFVTVLPEEEILNEMVGVTVMVVTETLILSLESE